MARESWASSPAVRASMRANRGRDTAPELAVRQAVHALGLRYRVNAHPLPTLRQTADLVFPKEKIAVFIDGCFWHGCAIHYRPSSVNAEFWESKREATRARDRRIAEQLLSGGWIVIRAWEHEDPYSVGQIVRDAVLERRSANL